jgi:hypothetical protein
MNPVTTTGISIVPILIPTHPGRWFSRTRHLNLLRHRRHHPANRARIRTTGRVDIEVPLL